MGLFARFRNSIVERTRYQMVTTSGNGFFIWDGKIYQSDIVRACIRPKVKAVGKLVGKHLRKTIKDGMSHLEVNPEPYIRFLLEDPNPYMSGQKLQEKLATQLALNNNAFAVILRDELGMPKELYPVPTVQAEAVYSNDGTLFLKFLFLNGKNYTFPYSDIIHLRQDFNENDLFGDSPAPALVPLMNVVSVTDQGIIHAIKNSGVVRWLLKFTQSMRPEDLRERAAEFSKNFLELDSNGSGVAATDAKSEAQQITPSDFVPNAAQMDRTTKRIYAFFNTNEKIVTSSYSEDDWNAYYEAEVEPVALELAQEMTRKLFSRRERSCGNSIVFEASNLATASMSTKLGLQAMVDRGAMLPNEWRAVLNLAPLPGGDEPIRRLDTAVVNAVETLSRQLGGDHDVDILSAIHKLLGDRKESVP